MLAWVMVDLGMITMCRIRLKLPEFQWTCWPGPWWIWEGSLCVELGYIFLIFSGHAGLGHGGFGDDHYV